MNTIVQGVKYWLSRSLVSFLSNYCDGINENDLNLGITDGHILLENIMFKESLFADLNLPLIVKHGSIKKFEMVNHFEDNSLFL